MWKMGEIICQMWGFGRDCGQKMSSGREDRKKNNLNESTEAGHSKHIWENSISGV